MDGTSEEQTGILTVEVNLAEIVPVELPVAVVPVKKQTAPSPFPLVGTAVPIFAKTGLITPPFGISKESRLAPPFNLSRESWILPEVAKEMKVPLADRRALAQGRALTQESVLAQGRALTQGTQLVREVQLVQAEQFALPRIINTRLKWDGSHLGVFNRIIMRRWRLERTYYYGIVLPNGWSPEYPDGMIYCNALCTKDVFPCIVEDIKGVFGLPRRGIHRITIDRKEYILYYIPISIKGDIIWETPLNRLDSRHVLRKDPQFKRNVQKIIAFCDILALCSTGEPCIRIRPGTNGEFIVINANERTTAISKGSTYDYSILTKTLFLKWFGEETSIGDIVKEMTKFSCEPLIKVPAIQGSEFNKLGLISAEMRDKIDKIIKRYDNNYIWYSCFIIDRMSRHLLIDI